MNLDIENYLPDGVQLTTGNPEFVHVDSDKTRVIMWFVVKPVDEPHAELKEQYERDVETCATIDDIEAWKLWQYYYNDQWNTYGYEPSWKDEIHYRRHPHADNIIAYHKCSNADKRCWQYKAPEDKDWIQCPAKEPGWNETLCYRLKPRTLSVTLQNGQVIEFPEPVREPLEDGDQYFIDEFDGQISSYEWANDNQDKIWLEQQRIYITQEDCQAAHDAIHAILSQRSE